MSQKNETPILILSLLITVGLIAGGFWWFTRKTDLTINQVSKPQSTTPSSNITKSEPSSKTFASVQDVPTGLFNYGGSTSWAPIRLIVDSALQAGRPEFRMRYVEPNTGTPGTGTGIQALIDGKLAFAQSSRPILDEELSRAKQRGFSLQQIPVAIDGLAVAVNPNLPVPGLTIDQLRSIYSGKITNWSQVGGPNIPINAYSRRLSDGGTVELFSQDILGGQAFGSNVEFISTTTQALQKVASNLGGIYYASAPEVVPQCSIKPLPLGRTQGQYVPPYQEPFVLPSECPGKRNTLNIEAFQSGNYPITRNLFVVVKQNAQIEERAGTAYANLLLTEQGQELISQAGFVKVR
ncbi:MAG: PstS family phosphate ABC transporter substrate-binding protein [Chlorogloeopsis fritschii C42_A2020_084]|uniref:PstS family phosphate ABC transporter substrate-binding protein n=1 Tax=Chlorogloeopsis fritschii TaxID=1124 RepID=UPI0019F75BE5|nr:PstS family phosphate ABC transporter substrate-binding protein [Chlorogloeopsis fritschii]MBF2006179.1 PstS family phosphate ABC transporter substrate-binding protein [Chlorogloeopsis fritschii C42_A2020_084]